MLNITDWIIILIAGSAALIALLMLYPHSHNRDALRLRNLRDQAELDKHQTQYWFDTLKQQAEQAGQLNAHIQIQAETITQCQERCEQNAQCSQELLTKTQATEQELQQLSTALSQRLRQVQVYWDAQLNDTVENIKQLGERLSQGLEHLETGLTRLQSQEHTVQTLTQQLVEHYQTQTNYQQQTQHLSAELTEQLTTLLTTSRQTFEHIHYHHATVTQLSDGFAQELNWMEQQASEHFTQLYQNTDQVRQEMSASLEEAQHHLMTLRRREEQTSNISQVLHQQVAQVDKLNLDQVIKTLESTQKLCGQLTTRLASTIETRSVAQPFTSTRYAEAVNH